MNASELFPQIKRHYLFAALSEPQWAQLSRNMTLHGVPEATKLFLKDDPATVFYVVLDGAIKLYRISAQGQEKIMRVVRSGQSFAESVLFSDHPRYPVSALALQDTEVIAVGRDAYLELLRQSFETCRAVMAQMTARIYAHWDEIEGLSLHGSQARVAHYLLKLQADNDLDRVKLPNRKGVIATQLGLAPETFSRALRAMIDRSMIHVHGCVIEIRDGAALERTAQS